MGACCQCRFSHALKQKCWDFRPPGLWLAAKQQQASNLISEGAMPTFIRVLARGLDCDGSFVRLLSELLQLHVALLHGFSHFP